MHRDRDSEKAIEPIGPTRRQVLRWGLVGGMLVAIPVVLPGCGDDDPNLSGWAALPTPTPIPSFFTSGERALLRAAVGRIIPTDDTAGALDAGADVYIERMLSIVPTDDDAAEVYASGPFSDRSPFASADGQASSLFAQNAFREFLPLTRLQLLSWRVRLLGSAAVEGSDFNGPVKGWREQYREGLAALDGESRTRFAKPFDAASASEQDQVLKAIDQEFVSLLTEHTIEGTFCAPEYGGNRDRIGWRMIGYDGDSQPLGYSLFDESTMSYRERPDKPNSTANPGDEFSGVDAGTEELLRFVVRTARPSFS